jgi:hypothetical protein
LIRKYGEDINKPLCVRHAILSCLYRLEVNQRVFGPELALFHLTESYRHTRQEIGTTDNAKDVMFAVIFMMLGAMLDDRYEEFYAHTIAFNDCIGRLLESNQFKGTTLHAHFVGSFAMLYYRRPQRLLTMAPEATWAMEDRMLESCQSLVPLLEKHDQGTTLVGTIRTSMYFWSVGKATEDMAANWPARPLKVDCPTVELAQLAKPEMKWGLKNLIGFADLISVLGDSFGGELGT